MEHILPLYWFDATSSDLDEAAQVLEEILDTDKGKKIRCRICQHIITDDSQRISINGSHCHSRSNPAGITFEFECFQAAPGSSARGTATNEYTWFAGYTWQFSVCNGCGEHLGWLFKSERVFYALITERLLLDEDSPG